VRAGFLLLCGLLLAGGAGRAAEPRPNLVVFVADDLGARDLGSYGSTFYETPHLDRLAREGTRFTRAYAACPVCSPTRAALLTGRYPQRTRITDYIGAAQPAAWRRNTRHLPAPYADRLALAETTFAEVLKEAGYATFFAGKWHLGPEGFWPENQGFDVNLGGIDRGGPYGGKRYFSPYGNPRLPDGPEGEHLPDRLAAEAAKFITANRSRPFLVYIPFYDVHTPLMARDDLRRKYEAKRAALGLQPEFGEEPPRRVRLNQEHAVYAGMVEAMDQAVGKVLARLDELGLAGNTLVLFTSDNGGLSTSEGSPTSNMPLRAGKGWLYEGGVRVPLLARWPGVAPAGAVNDTPLTSPDLFPTLLAAARLPARPADHLDGREFLSALRAGKGETRGPLFWHYPHYGNQGGAPGGAVLEGDWKLVEWAEDGRAELFNLAEDPGERADRAGAAPERVAALRAKLRAWRAEVGAVSSTPNPGYDPAGPNGRG
jgi:arylsulfatase A-like enzyme